MVQIIQATPWRLPYKCIEPHKRLSSVVMCHDKRADRAVQYPSQESENPVCSLEQNTYDNMQTSVYLLYSLWTDKCYMDYMDAVSGNFSLDNAHMLYSAKDELTNIIHPWQLTMLYALGQNVLCHIIPTKGWGLPCEWLTSCSKSASSECETMKTFKELDSTFQVTWHLQSNQNLQATQKICDAKPAYNCL